MYERQTDGVKKSDAGCTMGGLHPYPFMFYKTSSRDVLFNVPYCETEIRKNPLRGETTSVKQFCRDRWYPICQLQPNKLQK
jgi:hypothetical protein